MSTDGYVLVLLQRKFDGFNFYCQVENVKISPVTISQYTAFDGRSNHMVVREITHNKIDLELH